jgi:hypothetical protein
MTINPLNFVQCVKDLKIISLYNVELLIAQLVERMTVVGLFIVRYHQVAGSIPARETIFRRVISLYLQK